MGHHPGCGLLRVFTAQDKTDAKLADTIHPFYSKENLGKSRACLGGTRTLGTRPGQGLQHKYIRKI